MVMYLPPIEISHVEVLSFAGNGNNHAANQPLSPLEANAELIQRYTNARVRILPPDENAGAEGTVRKVIAGDWYITDNPMITKAYQADKFEVLQYAPGAVEAAEAKLAAAHAAASGGESEEAGEGDEEAGEGDEEHAAAVSDADVSNKVEKSVKKGENCQKDDNGNDGAEDIAAHALAPISSSQIDYNAATAAITRQEEEDDAARNLIGATVRITRGSFRGVTGTIRERQSIRHIQVWLFMFYLNVCLMHTI